MIQLRNQHWDIFCAVIDNYGDIGTCWRLARQLAEEYHVNVRLWVDKLESFKRLCPSVSANVAAERVSSIEIRHWPSDFPSVEAADVVIEAFACTIPAVYLAEMTRRVVAPVWINLEYLSAETWVEECHCLSSAQSRLSVKKHFFFPGFTSKTGGLFRESGLLSARAAFGTAAVAEFWREMEIPLMPATHGPFESNKCETLSRIDDEIRISLFCYENLAVPDLLQACSDGPGPVCIMTSPGAATNQVGNWFGKSFKPGERLRKGALNAIALPFLSQSQYDRLLWSCDVNFVRGEDSFVRAQWAQQPFVWQIYPQKEDAHVAKLDAFLTRYLADFSDSSIVKSCFRAWNGLGDMEGAWRDYVAKSQAIQQHGKVWASELDRAGNLVDNLVRFVCAVS